MSNFVDECGLNVRGGDGGAGCVSFRREAHVAKGGPDGGDGGKGGDVWLVADHNIASLLAFRDYPHRRAANGAHGSGKRKHGAYGADEIVNVPVGTVVRAQDGTVLADLAESGQRWRAARGGAGGRGNARFLTNRRRAPSFAEQGEHGEEMWLRLELKLVADVALVGFPNVGKSTFISRISAARPKIADYPFTTLEPNLGVVRIDENFEMVVADIPGLIEGAADGRGLGHQFLRHVERARVLCVLVDLAPYDQVGPAEQLATLLHELEAYQPDLVTRPRVVVGSKVDIADFESDDVAEFTMSAVTGAGIERVVGRLASLVAEARGTIQTSPGEEIIVHRPAPEGIVVERDIDGAWIVLGRAAERAVALNDLTNIEALEYVQERFARLGVDRALARAGATEGDVVRVGPMEFEYSAEGDLER
ncbi:MAG: GTPase ObgE [Acidimicrobiales bacterium]